MGISKKREKKYFFSVQDKMLFEFCLIALASGQMFKKVKLKDVDVLTLYQGKMTNGRRSSPVPQLSVSLIISKHLDSLTPMQSEFEILMLASLKMKNSFFVIWILLKIMRSEVKIFIIFTLYLAKCLLKS